MSKTWIKAALIRALKTVAQAMVAQIGAGSIGIVQFDWLGALSVSAMAAALSIFTSIAGLPEVELQQTLYDLDNEGDENYMNMYRELDDEEIDEEE